MPNEKTLELNITHELLEISRRRYDKRAFALGITLIKERHLGYDSRILGRLPHTWMASPKQFKRASRRRQVGKHQFVYDFDINNNSYNDQHLVLYHLTGGIRKVAFYVLPAIYTQSEFNNSLPNLLNQTFRVDVADIDPSWVDRQQHRIFLYPHLRMALFQSEREREIKVISPEEFVGLIAEKQIGISISNMLENMKLPFRGDYSPESKRPRFVFSIFPGFSDAPKPWKVSEQQHAI